MRQLYPVFEVKMLKNNVKTLHFDNQNLKKKACTIQIDLYVRYMNPCLTHGIYLLRSDFLISGGLAMFICCGIILAHLSC